MVIIKKIGHSIDIVALCVYFVFHLFKQLSFEAVPANFNTNIPIG